MFFFSGRKRDQGERERERTRTKRTRQVERERKRERERERKSEKERARASGARFPNPVEGMFSTLPEVCRRNHVLSILYYSCTDGVLTLC